MKQRAEIIFEKEETIILRESSIAIDSFCPMCQAIVVMVAPEAAFLACQIGEREIFHSLEGGMIHFFEGERVLVCLGCCRRSIGEDKKGKGLAPFSDQQK